MDLWLPGPALATFFPAQTTSVLAIGFLEAMTLFMPNFSLLDPPSGPEDGPVAPRAGPGHGVHGGVHGVHGGHGGLHVVDDGEGQGGRQAKRRRRGYLGAMAAAISTGVVQFPAKISNGRFRFRRWNIPRGFALLSKEKFRRCL